MTRSCKMEIWDIKTENLASIFGETRRRLQMEEYIELFHIKYYDIEIFLFVYSIINIPPAGLITMVSHIAYCGLDCAQCPAFIYTSNNDAGALAKLAKEWSSPDMAFTAEDMLCFGCHQEKKIFTWCASCDVRNCARQKGFENCAYCPEYGCKKIEMPHSKSPEAKQRLDGIHQRLQAQ